MKMNIVEQPIEFQKQVGVQYEAIRLSGQTNMFDQGTVRLIAENNDYNELVEAINNNGYSSILKNYSTLKELFSEIEIPECF